MKLLVITDLYPVNEESTPNRFTPTPRTIYNFVQGWKSLGHEVRVIKPNFLLNSFLRSKPFYKSGLYGEVENINYFFPFLGNIKNKIKTKTEGFDMIIAHMPSGLIFANRLNLGIPIVAGVHVSDLEVLTNPIYSIYFKQELKKAYKNAHKIVCRSEMIKKKFLKIFPEYEEKTFVAYSGINAEPVKKEWIQKEKYEVITCANLIKRKNVDKVIEACKKLNNVRLTVIGNGKEFKKLKKLADNSKSVRFTGYLNNKEVIEEMKKSDIFILPSQNETFGLVYLEAMAGGCITVGLENDGIDGIIKNNENGFLCRLDNIRETIENIINSENQNIILENTYNSIQNYTNKKACMHYLDNCSCPVAE